MSCFFHDSSEGIRHSVLLAPQVIGARVDDNVAGMAQLRFGQKLQGFIGVGTPVFNSSVSGEEFLDVDEFPI